jgi:N-acetylglutamate synthase
MEMIAELEELSMNAWPALQTMLYDGWVLRFSDGYTKRANSANPLYEGVLDSNEKIDACERLYSGRGLDTIFKLTRASFPADLDETLSARGYRLESESAVMTLELPSVTPEPEGPAALSPDVSDAWLSAFCEMNHLDDKKKRTAEQMLLNVIPRKCLAAISNGERKVVACGMAVLQGGHVGLFDIATREDFRRQGYGRRVTMSLLHWAKDNGARTAYLQVEVRNQPAMNLYSGLGFAEAYRYWYRIKRR